MEVGKLKGVWWRLIGIRWFDPSVWMTVVDQGWLPVSFWGSEVLEVSFI